MTKKEKLKKLKHKILKDKDLPLREGSTNLVFGEGDPDPKALFIGEGPGYWEDIKGRPFVGNAGKLLDQLLQSIKVERRDVFITNVIFYRPPGNRDPKPAEILSFQPYIDEIIEVIKPKVIVTLGRFSMRKFLAGAKISSVHGKPHVVNWKGRDVMIVPMYHPAAALRNGLIMSQIKQDFLKLPGILKEANKIEVDQMLLV